MAEQVESLGLFVSFPDLTSTEPSKAMLKKLEKLKEAKEKKAQKAAGKVSRHLLSVSPPLVMLRLLIVLDRL